MPGRPQYEGLVPTLLDCGIGFPEGALTLEAYVKMDTFGEKQPEKIFAGVVDKNLLARKNPATLANLDFAESWHFSMQGCSPVFGYTIPGFIGGGIELKAPANEKLMGVWQQVAVAVSRSRIALYQNGVLVAERAITRAPPDRARLPGWL